MSEAEYSSRPIEVLWEIQQDWLPGGTGTDGDCGPTLVVALRVGGGLCTTAPRDYVRGAPSGFTGAHVQALCRRMRAEAAGAGQDEHDAVTLDQLAEMAQEFAGVWDGKVVPWGLVPEHAPLPEFSLGADGRGTLTMGDPANHPAVQATLALLKEALGASPRGVIVPIIPAGYGPFGGHAQASAWLERVMAAHASVRGKDDLGHFCLVVGVNDEGRGRWTCEVFDPAFGYVNPVEGWYLAYLHLWKLAVPGGAGRALVTPRFVGQLRAPRVARSVPVGAGKTANVYWFMRMAKGDIVQRERGAQWRATTCPAYGGCHLHADAQARALATAADPPLVRGKEVVAVVEAPPGNFVWFRAAVEPATADAPFGFPEPVASIRVFQPGPAGGIEASDVVRLHDHTHRTVRWCDACRGPVTDEACEVHGAGPVRVRPAEDVDWSGR